MKALVILLALTACAAPSRLPCDHIPDGPLVEKQGRLYDPTGASWPVGAVNTRPTVYREYDSLEALRAIDPMHRRCIYAFSLTDLGPVCQVFMVKFSPAWVKQHEDNHCVGLTVHKNSKQ